MVDFSLNFSDGGAEAGLKRLLTATEQLSAKHAALKAAMSKGFETPTSSGGGKVNETLQKQIDLTQKVGASYKQLSNQVGSSTSGIRLGVSAASAAVVGLAASFVAGGTAAVRYAADMESLKANFTTFLKGDAQAVDQLVESINKFAAATPFTQGQIASGAQSLLAFGVAASDVVPTLQQLGDLSGGSADKLNTLVRIFGQAKNATTVYNEDLLQLAEAGLPIYDELAKITGRSVSEVKKLSSEGQIQFPLLQEAFKNLTSEGGLFFGLMEKQSKTFNGIVSTLQGDLEQVAAEVGAVFLPALGEAALALDELIKNIDTAGIKDAVEDAGASAKQFGNDFTAAFDRVGGGEALFLLRDNIQQLIDYFGKLYDQITSGIDDSELYEATVNAIAKTFTVLINLVTRVGEIFADVFGPSIDQSDELIKALSNSISTLLTLFSSLTDGGGSLSGTFSVLGDVLGAITYTIVTAIEIINELVVGIFGLDQKLQSSEPVMNAFGDAIRTGTEPLRVMYNWLRGVIGSVGEFFGVLESAESKAKRLADAQQRAQVAQQDDARSASENARDDRQGVFGPSGSKEDAKEKEKAAATIAAKKRTAEQIAKEAERIAKDRTRLELDLIADRYERERREEAIRYAEQVDDIKQLYGKGEQVEALRQAAEINVANIRAINEKQNEEIRKDAEASRDELEKIEADAIRRQIEANEKATELRQRKIEDAATLDELGIDLYEQTQNNYLDQLERSGASEEKIRREQARVDLEVQALRIEQQIKFNEAMLSTLGAGNEAQAAEIKASIQVLQAELAGVDAALNDIGGGAGIGNRFEQIREDISNALGIDVDELEELYSAATETVGRFFDAVQGYTQAQIEGNRMLVASLDEKIKKQEEAVEAEKELSEEGKANNLKTEQERLNGLLSQKEDAEKRGQELQARAVRFQLIQDGAAQASAIATSVANILKDTTKIPLVGVLVAAAQIAGLFALIASARARTKEATRFYRGGELPLGKSDENGGEGYHIEDTGIMVGGGEFVVNRRSTQRNKAFIRALNAGTYDNIDLYAAMSSLRDKSALATLGLPKIKAFDSGQMAAFQASALSVGADSDGTRSTGASDQKLEALMGRVMDKHAKKLIERGFSPLGALGQYYVDGDGVLHHCTVDAAGNITKVKYRKTN